MSTLNLIKKNFDNENDKLFQKISNNVDDIVNFLSTKKIQYILDIKKKVLENSLNYSEDVNIKIILWIIIYFIDYNYHILLEDFMKELWQQNFIKKIQSFVESLSDQWLKYLLQTRLFTINFYLNFVNDNTNITDLEKRSLTFFEKWISILEKVNKNDSINSRYYFSIVNSQISYLNYLIPILKTNTSILEKYFDVQNSIISKLIDNYKLSELSDVKKSVFIANVKFFNKLSWFLWKTQHYDIHLKECEFGLSKLTLFNLDYAKIDVVNWQLVDIEDNFPWWIDLLDDNLFPEKVDYLANYSSSLIIKKVAKLILKFLDEKKNTHSYSYKVNYFVNNLIWYLNKQLQTLELDKIDLFFRACIVRFGNLSLNIDAIKVNYKFNSTIPYNIKFISNKLNSDFLHDKVWKEIVVFKHKDNNFSLEMKVWLSQLFQHRLIDKDYITYNINYLNTLVNTFIKIVQRNYLFLNKTHIKLTKLDHYHIETINHMQNIWELLKIFINDKNLQKEKEVLYKLSNYIFVDFESFLWLLWYLHDIWKADNVHNLEKYNKINWQVFPYVTFLDICNKLIKKIKYEQNVNNNNNDRGEIQYANIVAELSKDEYILKNVNSFVKTFSIENISNAILSKLINAQFIYSVVNITKYIKWNDLVKDISIIKTNVRKSVLQSINNTIQEIYQSDKYKNDNNIRYGFELSEDELDSFFLALLVFFTWITNLYKKDLTYPHMTYWLQFFAFNQEFDILSWVLFHHNNYPFFNEVRYYNIDNSIKKWCDFTWNKKLKDIIDKYSDKEYFKAEDKDSYMVLITSVDLIDALMWGRSYQSNENTRVLMWYDPLMKEIFNDSFRNNIIRSVKNEKFENLEVTFNNVIKILNKEFKNNPNRAKIKQVIIDHKEEIISFYKNKKEIKWIWPKCSFCC